MILDVAIVIRKQGGRWEKTDKVIFADEQQDEQHPGGAIGLARQDSFAVRRGAEPRPLQPSPIRRV